MVAHAWLIPLFPMLAFGSILGLGRRAPGRGAGVGVAMLGLSLLLSLGVLGETIHAVGSARLFVRDVPWAALGSVRLDVGYLVDPLTSVMLVVVTVVGLLVQVYSVGYMEGDPRFPLFYAYLSLFTAAMLGLVLASNLLVLYACWEVMGLTSYLLIGFWFEKPSAARAAKKAFMVTRVGDIGFFFGILLLIAATGTINLRDLVMDSPALVGGTASGAGIDAGSALLALKATVGGATVLGWIAMLIFCGAIGKSAQFPLHVWLPDAMEGPTPVSALIHAATMVAAGVYLVARMYPVFTAAGPVALLGVTASPLQFVAWIGMTTTLLASVIALTQPDFKRILAYSTISQLGTMTFALGIGAFTAATFHLMTHAFFKALLFLGSGSVIHGTGTQNIWEMGGLRRKMPTTYRTFLVGALALAGIPPLAGFWSKDAILDHAFHENRLFWSLGLLGAFLTAFYMTRLTQVVFGGEWRGTALTPVPSLEAEEASAALRASHGDAAGAAGGRHDAPHAGLPSREPHESPRVMTGPLLLLAALAVAAGWVGTPAKNWYGSYVFASAPAGQEPIEPMTLGLMAVSTLVALCGIGLGVVLYPNGRFRFPRLADNPAAMACYRFSLNKLYLDELYWRVLIVPLLAGTQFAARFDQRIIDGIVNAAGYLTLLISQLYRLFDSYVVDGVVNLVAWIPKQVGRTLRYVQTGQIQAYLLGLCFGAILLFWLFLRMV
jgi:proton-translocating NADH-quinone oxidoreductase chain L